MKEVLITPTDFLEFMSEKNYKRFINVIRKKLKIDKEKPIWIIGQFLEDSDKF